MQEKGKIESVSGYFHQKNDKTEVKSSQTEESIWFLNAVESNVNINYRTKAKVKESLNISQVLDETGELESFSNNNNNDKQYENSQSFVEGSSCESQNTVLIPKRFNIRNGIDNAREPPMTLVTRIVQKGDSSNQSFTHKTETQENNEVCSDESIKTDIFLPNYESLPSNTRRKSNGSTRSGEITDKYCSDGYSSFSEEIPILINMKNAPNNNEMYKKTEKNTENLSSAESADVILISDNCKTNKFKKRYIISSSSDTEDLVTETNVKKKKKKNYLTQKLNSEAEQSTKNCVDSDSDQDKSFPGTVPRYSKYTWKDDTAIINYIYTENHLDAVRGRAIWEDMERKKILPGRSWHSLKERFRRRIFPRIECYRKSFDGQVIEAFLDFASKENEKATHKKKKSYVQYSVEEDESILKFIIKNKRYNEIKGRNLWIDMAGTKPFKSRTWESLKNRFLTYIAQNLDQFDLKYRKKHKFDKVLKDTLKPELSKKERSRVQKYSEEEDYCILNFIISRKKYREVKGKSLWESMAEEESLKRRTWESLKNRFLKNISPSLDKYELDPKARSCLESALKVKASKRSLNKVPPFKRPERKRQRSIESKAREDDFSDDSHEPKNQLVGYKVLSSNDDRSESSISESEASTVSYPTKCALSEAQTSKPERRRKEFDPVYRRLDADHREPSSSGSSPPVELIEKDYNTNSASVRELSNARHFHSANHKSRSNDEYVTRTLEIPTNSTPKEKVDGSSKALRDSEIPLEETVPCKPPEENRNNSYSKTKTKNQKLNSKNFSEPRRRNGSSDGNSFKAQDPSDKRSTLSDESLIGSSTNLSFKLRYREINK